MADVETVKAMIGGRTLEIDGKVYNVNKTNITKMALAKSKTIIEIENNFRKSRGLTLVEGGKK